MSIKISENLRCEVDQAKCDCKREPAHCHITKRGVRVAQVWLDPVYIESGHSLDKREEKIVEEAVKSYKYELKREYEYNREHGADY